MLGLILALGALVEQIAADPANRFEVRGPELRVRQTAGGPRLFRDGEMIRPRFAYVSFGTGATPIGADWTKAELPFVLPRSFARLQIQMRFPQPSETGDVSLRGLSIRRADGKPLDCAINGSFGSDAAFAKTWRQTVGIGGGPALCLPQNLDRVSVKPNEHPFPSKYADGVWTTTLSPWDDKTRPPDYTLVSSYFGLEADVEYVLSYEARSTVVDSVLPSLYSVSEDERRYSFIPMGTNSPAVSTLRYAAAVGVHPTLYCPPDNRYPEGEDWRWNDLYCDQLVKADPQVLLIPRLKIDAPEWWLKTHPDARMKNEKDEWISQSSVASRDYREDTLRYLARFLRHMCERYPQNFGGIQPVGQSTSEWFYQGSQVKMTGYGPSTREAFRRWLKEHGRAGWETAEVPSPERRRAKAEGSVFVDPVAQADVLDFNRFLQDDMADFLGDVFALCRRLTKGRKLVYTFYGYGFEFLCNGPTPAATGHYGLQRLLDRSAADMDMMCAPISYINRGWTGTSINMGVPETVERAGIMWFDENDSRTYLARPSMADSGPGLCLQTKERTMDVVRRDTSREILRNYGSWWMDLQGRGWWNDSDIWRIIPETGEMERKMLGRTRPFSPEIALIIDEESLLHVGANTVRELGGIVHGRRMLSLIGAPFGQYLLSDVARNGLDAKFQVYLATWFGKVPPPRKGVVRLFVQVPGAPEPSGLGPDDIVMPVREVIPGFYDQKSPEWKRPLKLRDLAEKAGVRFHLDRSEVGKAVVWASDGYVSIQAIEDGFRDYRKGECRFFQE